ncbi:MAG: methyltransferase domain-containing protein [Immundisolibacterales bacterium]|nr:methyltransferase domain-containing protein [Immundisolibacterales bacterium]
MTERGGWYETHAAEAAARYESVAAEQINAWLLDLLPNRRAFVLDVGAGSGRDTAWLTSLGHEVVATDPSAAMRAQSRRWHPELGVQYLPDRLPELTKAFRTGISFDFILVNAVWMHVAPADRKRAFRKLVTLLKPGGVIAFTLRKPIDAARDMHPVSGAEIEKLARQHGAFVERSSDGADFLGRSPIRWEQIAVRVPDDGTGALPLLRHVILNDDKSSTYKLALLRVLCRIADSAAGWSVDESGSDGDGVDLPLGLVALYWIRLFKPLLGDGRDLPQMPGNVGLRGLSFVREGGFPLLLDMPDIELRAGMQIADSRRLALHRALRDARNTIVNMPAKFLTLHDGSPVFPVKNRRPGRATGGGRLDAPYLWSFGSFTVPRHLWRVFQRYNVWIEPALVAEWIRMMNDYAKKQGRKLDETGVTQGMVWSEPGRAVDVSRGRAGQLLDQGSLRCVWSGNPLTKTTLDIDHCFPWSSWPCGDLWNLLPASRNVNQHQKRDRLPADLVLRRAKERIVDWWDAGYVRAENRLLTEQFALEASATLPTLDFPAGNFEDVLAEARLHHLLEDIFSAVSLQRIRLSNDQQIPEWQGPIDRGRP